MTGRVHSIRLAIWIVFAALLSVGNFVAYSSSGSTSSMNALFQWSTAAGSAIGAVIWVAISFAISNGKPELRALRRSQISLPAVFGLGLLALVATFVASAIVSVFGGNPAREQGLLTEHWQSGHSAAFAANAVALVVLAPFTEELFVRGLGFGLFRPLGRSVSIIVPALVWALMHGIPAGILPLAVFGIGLGYLRERSDSVVPGMFVHGLFNGMALALAYGL
ncbi:MAG: CPBP family intramembrane glutamic endopeptidase [Gaiellaceae bacterium]